MPPLIGAVIAGVVAGSTVAGIGFSVLAFAGSLVMSGLSMLLAPKAPKNRGGARDVQSGITQSVRQAIINRKPLYGEMRVGGSVLYIGMTNTNKYLHMVLAVAPHEVAEISEVWLNDISIAPDALDSEGVVLTGRYANKVRIRKHLGEAAQAADTYLISASPDWTSNHKLSGIAYIYIRLEWDADIFPTGIPNISAWVRGKKIYDPRTTLTAYSDNVGLILNDYLEWEEYGLGADTSEIDQTYLTAAINTCDEWVTVNSYSVAVTSVGTVSGSSPVTYDNTLVLTGDKLFFQRGDRVTVSTTGSLPSGISAATNYYVIPYQRSTTSRIKLASSYANAMAGTPITISSAGTGTHTVTKNAEPKFAGAMLIETESSIGENIKSILAGMNGFLTYSGGVYRMVSGTYQTPTLSFDEGDIVSSISLQTKLSKRERFNTVRGVYISPINGGEPTDYPQITNSTYVANDGEELVRQVDMTMTTRPHMAQRIAKQALELSRQELTWSADFNLKAMQLVAGENAYFTVSRFGWTNKVFQVKDWELATRNEGETIVPVVKMTLREIASDNYDWNNGEETLVDPSPNSTLPSVYTVSAVTGLAVSSELVATQSGDNVFKVLLQWDLSDDQFVVNGGHYEIQYKQSSEVYYRPTYIIEGSFDFAEVTLASELNVDYDIRMRAVNSLGVKSGYTTILNYLVGTSGGVGTTEDWGDFASSPVTTEDWGDFASSPVTTEDWGFFT
jgi:hypothetical protein